MEMVLMPWGSLGSMMLPAPTRGDWLEPIMRGTLGPWISAAMRPPGWPSLASAVARLTASVVFPTPPLPEPTAMIFDTPGSVCGPGGVCICAMEIPFRPLGRHARSQLALALVLTLLATTPCVLVAALLFFCRWLQLWNPDAASLR